jgi:hypothetical protein
MKTLQETIRIKSDLESTILHVPGVTGMDVSSRKKADGTGEQFIIRIFVQDESVTRDRLHLQSEYKEVPIEVMKRTYHPQ